MSDLIKRLRHADAPYELEALMDEAADSLEALQKSLDQLHGAKFSDRTYAALVDRADRNEVDAAIGRTVLTKTVILDGSIEGMTVLTLAADADGFLGDAVRKAVEALSATKEQR